MTEIGQSKAKSGSDVKSLVDITNKLASLDIRQNRIFTKLANLHKKFAKHKGLDRVEQELLSLQVVVS
jgi:hypothetical protein